MHLTKDQLQKAKDRFMALNPKAKTEINSISSSLAETLGVELEQLKEQKTYELIKSFAAQNNTNYLEVIFELAADSPEEKQSFINKHNQATKKALGL